MSDYTMIDPKAIFKRRGSGAPAGCSTHPVHRAVFRLALLGVLLCMHASSLSANVTSVPGQETPKTLDRDLEPVVLLGSSVPDFLGKPVEVLFVYAYSDGSFSQIPVQVDEVTAAGEYTAWEDGMLDEDDEIVFMARDLGDRLHGRAMPRTLFGVRFYEIEVTDPSDPSKKGWAYVLRSTLLQHSFFADYIDYDDDLRRLNSARYSLGLGATHPGFDDLELGGSGRDILDRTKIRIFTTSPGPGLLTEEDVGTPSAQFIKDGPVRVILHDGEVLAYGTLLRWNTPLLRSILEQGDVSFSTDFNNEAVGAVYYNAVVPGGVTVDGTPDSVASIPLSPWWQLTTDDGTLVQAWDTASGQGTQTNVFVDDSTFDPSDTGDQSRYGESGVLITDPDLAFDFVVSTYFLEGNQPNVGEDYAAYFDQPLSVVSRPLAGFIPEDVRLGDSEVSYLNLEFSPDMRYATWVEHKAVLAATPAWMCGVDPQTGDLIPSDGKGVHICDIINYVITRGTPQWGEDRTGPFAIAINGSGRMVMARPESPTQATVRILPTPPTVSRLYPYPAHLPESDHSYVAFLQKDAGDRHQAWYIDLSAPEIVNQVTFGDQGFYEPMNKFPLAVDIHRWFYGEPVFVYGYENRVTGKIQMKQFDVSNPEAGPTGITYDRFNHIDDFPATLFGEKYLMGGINNLPIGMLYKKTADSATFKPQRFIVPVGTNFDDPTSALGFEPFTWGAKAFASFHVRESSELVLDPQAPGEIWLTSLFDRSVIRRISPPQAMVRTDPEFFIGESEVWVYYVAKPVGSQEGWELHRARTGLKATP